MRMFFYYAIHSVKNQIKKLFKTWVLVFLLVCMLFGGIIGLGIGFLADEADTLEDTSYSEELEEEEITEDIAEDEFPIPEGIEYPEREFTELAAGAIILAVIFFSAFGADKSANAIFLPADVNLLFPAPLKPQSVLLFRLMTQIGVILCSSLYISFQIPNMVLNMGLGVWTAIGFIVALLLLLMLSKLLQVFIYLLASTKPFIKKHLRTVLFGVLSLIGGAFYLYINIEGASDFESILLCAFNFYNHPLTRFIPIIGCLKAFCVHIVSGNILGIAANLLGIIISGVILGTIISKIKVDFYEEALAKSQETAELQAIAQEQKVAFVKRKKDRSDKLKRDGITKGWGANIFFYRSMYNRFRFAHLGIFTKTSETYLLVSLLVIAVCKLLLEVNGFTATVLIIGAFVFFRTLGNPLEEDTGKDFFRLIPEKTSHKLFYSSIAGTVNCLFDILPAIIIATGAFGQNPLIALIWCLLILSVDFYGTNVGAFINISVSVKAGSMVKNIVQIMFIYFGLLPDAIIIVIGFLLQLLPVALPICALINFGLGLLFLCLTPAFMDVKETVPKI